MQVSQTLQEMADSMASTRQLVASLNEKFKSSPDELDTKEGISLLSVKNHVLISYLRSLALLNARRTLGHSLLQRTQCKKPFSDKERDERGTDSGDLVDSLIEGRLVLEKIKVLEGRMKYQIDKLVRIAKEDAAPDVLNDPLVFRPNPRNLVNNEQSEDEAQVSDAGADEDAKTGIYRPPRLAPMPYVPSTSSKDKKSRQPPEPKALKSLLYSDPSQPHIESASGLGGPSSSSQMSSSRARYLKHLTEFEESQFGRVMLSKKEEKKRRRDEAALSMGGALSGVAEDGFGGRTAMRAGGLEDEFLDVIRDKDDSRRARMGDGYEELRKRSKMANALERSRNSKKVAVDDSSNGPQKRKRSRFELERKSIKKRKF